MCTSCAAVWQGDNWGCPEVDRIWLPKPMWTLGSALLSLQRINQMFMSWSWDNSQPNVAVMTCKSFAAPACLLWDDGRCRVYTHVCVWTLISYCTASYHTSVDIVCDCSVKLFGQTREYRERKEITGKYLTLSFWIASSPSTITIVSSQHTPPSWNPKTERKQASLSKCWRLRLIGSDKTCAMETCCLSAKVSQLRLKLMNPIRSVNDFN